MGGGDLNLKKSWHPSTYSNLKRLWEAEQASLKEQQKLDQLRKEKDAEREREEMRKLQEAAGLITKQPERVEWLYTGASAPSQSVAEGYLLGNHRFDQQPAELQQNSSRKPVTPSVAEARDLQEKLREDPLLSIKMNERMASVGPLSRHQPRLEDRARHREDNLRQPVSRDEASRHRHDRPRLRSRSRSRSRSRTGSSRPRSRSRSHSRTRSRPLPRPRSRSPSRHSSYSRRR